MPSKDPQELADDMLSSQPYSANNHAAATLLVEQANEIELLRADFAKLRLGICDHATDTVWIDERGTTAVDFISIILDDGDWYNEVYLPSKESDQ